MRVTAQKKILQLKTNAYAAAVVLDSKGICRESAPILRWMIGKGEKWIRHHCEKHNIEVLEILDGKPIGGVIYDDDQTDTDDT